MDKEKIKIINNLICEVRVGNKDSLLMLHEKMSPTIRYIALKYLKNKDEAQDIVQEFWADIYRISSSFVFLQNGFSYLCKVMTRKTINAYKKLHREQSLTISYVDYCSIEQFAVDESLENFENRMDVSNAMAYLSDLQKIIIQEIYFEQKPLRDIGKGLHIPTTKVFEEKSRAIEIMKKVLEKSEQK